MSEPPPPDAAPQNCLDQISTRWPIISDPMQFTLCYAPAIRRYLEELIPNLHDAEDVLQDFLLRGLVRGFVRTEPVHGRFRHYLKVAVRNAALDHLRRRRLPAQGGYDLTEVPAEESAPDRIWLSEWQQCVLARAWEALYKHQRRTPGNFFHTALRLTGEYPEETSDALATRAATVLGRSISPASFRQQVSRGRRLFAELILQEVRQTLEQPTPAHIEEELTETGLLSYVRDYLPDDWRTRGQLADSE
jgi:hypothetical protein